MKWATFVGFQTGIQTNGNA